MAEADKHGRKVLDGFIPFWTIVGVPPSLSSWWTLTSASHNPGSDVGASDVHRQNSIVISGDSACQVDATDEAGHIGMMVSGNQVHREIRPFKHGRRPSYGNLSNPSGAKTASDHDCLRVLPRVELE
jgi:hypothetical protein